MDKPTIDRGTRQARSMATQFTTREDENNEKRIEGYFIVFNSNYDMGDGMSESVDPHALDDTISGDIRALINHDTTLVIGRTTARTLELRIDAHGVWGSVLINPNDQDALNIYARVQRGDVTQCSFGFDILDEEYTISDNGDIHWTIKAVKLYEVSVCTFPAYEQTNVDARNAQKLDIMARQLNVWRENMRGKIDGIKNSYAPTQD